MTAYYHEPMSIYLDDLASEKDAPGGGSACGLAGALASALGSMVCHFTMGRKKYAAVEGRVKDLLEQFDLLRKELAGLMQEDVDVFHSQMGSAFSMPKETEEQKKLRQQAIEEACKASCQPPLQIARNCFFLMEMLRELGEIGTTQLVSDVGVATALAYGAFEGAKLNVEINLKYITDETFVNDILSEFEPLVAKVTTLKARTMEIVQAKMAGK